jgi:hypothetical protein
MLECGTFFFNLPMAVFTKIKKDCKQHVAGTHKNKKAPFRGYKTKFYA